MEEKASITVTEQWLKQHATARGGYTKCQLEIIGVGWPPPTGWKARVVGNAIGAVDAKEFERLSGQSSPRGEK
jgi:hypothetical protein